MVRWSGSVTVTVGVPVGRVWEIAEFWGLDKWDPSNIESSDIVEGDGYTDGSVRCVVFNYPDGSTGALYERLTKYDPHRHTYSYEMGHNPFGYRGYCSTFRLDDGQNGTTIVSWSFELDAMQGSSERSVVGLIESVFQRRISLLQEMAYAG